jgi:tetratricopeptide (TPR) repeat protein
MKRRNSAAFAALVLIFCFLPMTYAVESLLDIDVSAAKSPAELQTVVERLNAGSLEKMHRNAFTYEFQSTVLKKAGECIDKVVSLHGRVAKGTDEQERSVLLINREVIKRILDLNKKILEDYQEKLDTVEDPLAFFKTPAWRQPEELAATACFQLGWNDYYAGLLFPEDDPMGKQLFSEAVESFSRAFVEAKDDKTVITSLFGRGLCHRRLKAYKDALKDFKSVKDAVKKDDLMYLRCRYEETVVASLIGNFKEVLLNLDEIDREYPAAKIPAEMKTSLKTLRESSLRAISEKAAEKTENRPVPSEEPSGKLEEGL